MAGEDNARPDANGLNLCYEILAVRAKIQMNWSPDSNPYRHGIYLGPGEILE